MNDTNTIEVTTSWVGNKVSVIARQAGVVLHVDACDPGSAPARKRLLGGLANKVPSVDVGAIEQALAALAAEGPPTASSGPSIVPDDPEPWPAPVDGVQLVHEIEARLRRYVVLPEYAGIACALWSLHTFCFREFAYTPRLFFTSGTKRSGKSVAASRVASLCSRPLSADNISAAAVYRVVEAAAPTLACDEVDSWLVPKSGATESSEALRGVCNSGFARDGCTIRCSGENSDPKRFATFAPMILAGIGQLPDTLADRSITIRMMRRGDGEQVERRPAGTTAREEDEDLVRKARRWVADNLPAIRESLPTMPDIASDRARDVWFPLLALGEVVGGDVPARARAAAIALTAAVSDDAEDVRTRLLADVRDAFGTDETMTTAGLLTYLHAIVDAPWPHWSGGRPMSGDSLAKVLRSFGVQPARFRVGGLQVRGYTRTAMADAWARYLPARTEAGAPLAPSRSSHPSQVSQATAPVETGVTGVTGVTPPRGAIAVSPVDAEIAELVEEMVGELADPRTVEVAGYTGADLREHLRGLYRRRGAAETLQAARWRREQMVLGNLPALDEVLS